MKVRVCPNCGKNNLENVVNCIDCGATLSINTLMDTESGQFLNLKPITSRVESNETSNNQTSEGNEESKNKARDIVFGFFGWFILGNLFLIFFYFGPGLTVTLIWMSTIITILLLFDKKRIWVMTGIISAFIINLIINTWLVYMNYPMPWEYPTSELIMLITSPFPGIWGFFLN